MNEFRVRLAVLHPNSHEIRLRYYTLYSTMGRSSLAAHTEKGEINRTEWRMLEDIKYTLLLCICRIGTIAFGYVFAEYIHHRSASSCHS